MKNFLSLYVNEDIYTHILFFNTNKNINVHNKFSLFSSILFYNTI